MLSGAHMPEMLRCVPTGHARQLSAPAAAENVPMAHGKHSEAPPVAPKVLKRCCQRHAAASDGADGACGDEPDAVYSDGDLVRGARVEHRRRDACSHQRHLGIRHAAEAGGAALAKRGARPRGEGGNGARLTLNGAQRGAKGAHRAWKALIHRCGATDVMIGAVGARLTVPRAAHVGVHPWAAQFARHLAAARQRIARAARA